MNKKLQRLKYIVSDYFASIVIWTLFFAYRKLKLEGVDIVEFIPSLHDPNYLLGVFFIPVFWILLFYSLGHYNYVYRRSRLSEFGQTFQAVLIGVIFIFFILLLDDNVYTYKNYYKSIGVLFSLQFLLVYIPRLIITTRTTHKIHRGEIGFPTLIIGGNGNACEIYNEIISQKKGTGNKIIGFVSVNVNPEYQIEKYLPKLGDLNYLQKIIQEHNVEEVIIAIDPKEHDEIGKILNILEGCNVIINSIPSMYDILSGRVRMSAIFGAPLIKISHDLMPPWQQRLKIFIDIIVSIFAVIILLPFGIILAIAIKIDSHGPVFYNHERLGRYGKPFKILKFRSMYIDAERSGPSLSTDDDPRVTKVGRFMRKMRLDELPNFINVLKGEMSLVGPRPERKFYVDQILKVAPHYLHLQKVKPGITSWGQVKFGYASNVEEMVKRLKYDIIYIENMSLYVDFKILIYTLLTIIKREGK